MKRIAFCTTVKNRTGHLKLTLPKNLRDNSAYPNAVFIVLDYSSQDDLLPYLFSHHQPDMESGRLVVYSFLDPHPGPFRMAHAKNLAARCGMIEGAEVLVTQDADNWTGEGFAENIDMQFHEHENERIFLCPDFPLIKSLPHGPLRPQRGYGGRLAIRAQDFIKSGGYDEQYHEWGSEDIDLIFRLERMGYSKRYIPNDFLRVIPHGPDIRFKEYPDARRYETPKHVMKLEARTERVVNYGKIGVGTVRRHPDARTIDLGPVPTRVFGIGMHKTGTSSLHRAFQILGMDSFHWGRGEAPRIWQEMNASPSGPGWEAACKAIGHPIASSKTLEQWYAFSDNPFPLLYEKLDKGYPGSKFILTIRDEKDWLRSVERLWDHRYNPTRWVWDKYPFTNHIHSILYNHPQPLDPTAAPEIFLRRYRQHTRQVLDYFKGRGDDLCVINIPGGEGWNKLCRFLNYPIPPVPFPWNNGTKGNFAAAISEVYSEQSIPEPETQEEMEPSSSSPGPEPDVKLSRRRRHHHHHKFWLLKWLRRVWWGIRR